jgi:hypothetical protein
MAEYLGHERLKTVGKPVLCGAFLSSSSSSISQFEGLMEGASLAGIPHFVVYASSHILSSLPVRRLEHGPSANFRQDYRIGMIGVWDARPFPCRASRFCTARY